MGTAARRHFVMLSRMKLLFCGCAVCIVCTIVLSLTCSCEEQFAVRRLRRITTDTLQGTKNVSKLPSTYLMIAIMSAPGDAAMRAVIRDTWLKLSSKGEVMFRHAFPIGTKNLSVLFMEHLKEENNLFGDLIFLDNLIDTYQNLTKKTLLSMQALHSLYKFEFFLKVDSDSFVRLGAFLKALKDIAHPKLYWGFLDGRARPRRKGQWAERDWVLCDRYLPYQLGGGYVLSYKLVDFIVRNKDLLKLYKSEDVSVGAWLAGLDVRYVHDPRFDTEFRSRGCNNQYIITHKQTPQSFEKLYALIVKTGKLCEKEYRIRSSYVYDWSLPPKYRDGKVTACIVTTFGTMSVD